MAVVRSEFRADVVQLDPADPVFGGALCQVPDCRRLARSRVCAWVIILGGASVVARIWRSSPLLPVLGLLARCSWPVGWPAAATASTVMAYAVDTSTVGGGRNDQNCQDGWLACPPKSFPTRRRAARSPVASSGRS
jgi:hypothetical protein